MLLKRNMYVLLLTLCMSLTQACHAQKEKKLYSNGSVFKVIRYINTDLDGNIIKRNDNVKQTTFTIESKNKVFVVKMADIYYERYYYSKVDRITIGGNTKDVYKIYKSYNSQEPTKTLTDVLILELNPSTNSLKSYKLYFGDKGFITFYLTSIK